MGGDLDRWIEDIKQCKLLAELDLKHLCEYVQELMLEESTVQPVQSPVTICGDIHGQFHDLLELFNCGGPCPETSYIFMVRARRAAHACCQSTDTRLERVCAGFRWPVFSPGGRAAALRSRRPAKKAD